MSPLVAFLVVLLASRTPESVAADRSTLSARKTVAVLSFDNNTGQAEYDPLGKGMAAMMTTDLSSVEEIQLLERERLHDVTKEIENQQTRYYDSTTAVKVGRLVGAQYIVTGAFVAMKPRIRIDTRVVRVETGEIVKTAQVTGHEDEFFDLEKRLARQLLNGLGVALTPESERRLQARQDANRVDNLSTMVQLSEAIALSDRGDYVGATARMAPVLKAAPNSLVVRTTYDEIKKRAASKTKDRAKEGLIKILRRPPA